MKPLYAIAFACAMLLNAGVGFPQSADSQQQEFAKHIQKAGEFLREKRPDLAIPEFKAALALNPEDSDTQGNLGVLLYFQENYADAEPHLRAALSGQPGLTKIQGLLGIAEVRTQDFTSARRDLEASFPQISDKKFKVQVGLELVGLYTQSGDLETASDTIAQLRATDPANPEVLYSAYRTYSDLAGESMMALALASPDSAQMHQVLAHEEIRQGDTNGALAEYRKAIAIDPHLPGVHFELAELLNTSADLHVKQGAVAEYRAALRENPQDEKAVCRLGDLAVDKGDNTEALAEYSKAVQLQPGDAEAKLDLAKTLLALDQPDKALPLLEQAVQLEPGNAVAHYRLSMLYRQKGRADDAKREMDTYRKCKELKEKLRLTYKELLRQPDQIRDDDERYGK